ncbi:glycosyltransferase family 2 protein [Caldisericum sp.]|uniref:glycosyltransferase family 2 protein n=1 Tax=Caldisericum sp. TaxID=2499687 RepID=UPI003D0B5449
MRKFTSQEIKEFVSKPLFDEKVILNKDPSWPKISIVTPSYNQAEFLERTILSVLNQNYPNLEYIIIDGGSTDGSVEIIKKYEKYLSYWVSEKDRGQAHALNKGFEKAAGDLVGWQNSDDIYLPYSFFEVVDAWKKYPDYDVVYGNVYLIDENDNILRDMRYIPFNLDYLIYYDWNLSSQGVFWKRSLFDKIGYLENYPVCFDLDWFIRLGKTTKKFKFIRKFLGGYRIHSRSKFSLIKRNEREPLILEIMQKHGIKVDESKSWYQQYKIKKIKAFLFKFLYYFIQGDIDYIYKGFLRRLKSLVRYNA